MQRVFVCFSCVIRVHSCGKLNRTGFNQEIGWKSEVCEAETEGSKMWGDVMVKNNELVKVIVVFLSSRSLSIPQR